MSCTYGLFSGQRLQVCDYKKVNHNQRMAI